MGTHQTKAAGSDPGTCSLLGFWRRTQSSLLLRRRSSSVERAGRVCTPPPYQRRVGLIQELLVTVKAGRREEAMELLKTLRQDLGMEATSLDDVLQSSTSLGNLVDPITHQLILVLVRYVQCPKTEGESLSAMEKVCRQLTYHLSPHSQWRRQGLFGNKPLPSLKSSLSGAPVGGAVELSGIPLSLQDMELLSAHLRLHSPRVRSLELGFTGLTDRALLLLVPSLAALPALETLVLNGNRLTRAVLRPLTDLLADPTCFPALTWMDLGNNEDIVSLPQAFLKGLRRRCPGQGRLPTIQEQGEEQGGGDGGGGGETGRAEVTCCCRAVDGGEGGEEGGKDGEVGEEWGDERGREWGDKGDEEELEEEDKGLGDSAADRITEEEHGNKTSVAHRELGESSIQTSQPTGTDK